MKQESNIENKTLIHNTKLFKEVSSVIGKVAALEELTKAYREYTTKHRDYAGAWHWEEPLINAFIWDYTPQGGDYWTEMSDSIAEDVK